MIPAWELEGHWVKAKSIELQRLIAFGFPKTPSGVLTLTLRAASGAPGASNSNDIPRSGCPPAWVVVVVTSKAVIPWFARAGEAATRARAIDAASVAMIVLALIVLVSLLCGGACPGEVS